MLLGYYSLHLIFSYIVISCPSFKTFCARHVLLFLIYDDDEDKDDDDNNDDDDDDDDDDTDNEDKY